MEVHVRCNRPDDKLILSFTGDLDLATAEQVDETLQAFGAVRFVRVGFDLAGISFCDCAGLNALINARRMIADAGGQLRIAGASGPVRRLLAVTRCEALIGPAHGQFPPA